MQVDLQFVYYGRLADCTIVVSTTLDEIKELRDQLNYHAVMHGLAQKWKLDFAVKAELRGNELATFLHVSEKDQEMRLSRLYLPEALKILNKYMWKRVEAAQCGEDKITPMAIQKNQKTDGDIEGLAYSYGDDKSARSWGTASVHDFFLDTENDFVSQGSFTKQEPATEIWSGAQNFLCFTCGETSHVTKDCRVPDILPETYVQYDRLFNLGEEKSTAPSKL